ncbi:hypothetical protein ACJZL1_01930 [Wolbachia endosymbiont of Rhagoletis indifferens]|uniref:hypothetical protein n=1 Tax=Wolbachia endosymbiont of Rhagoletis indifferens TaxID=3383250 RepID=UPI003AF3D7DE
MRRQCVKCYGRFCLKHKGVIPVLDTGIHSSFFLDSSGLCCIATEKIWWLLTKFIINNHLTVEEKICHRK